MDHSTNPLSSHLYKIRFKHSAKQWPEGRFCHYKEKMDQCDGTIIPITCTRTYPLVPKRKKIEEKKNDELISSSIGVVVVDPITQEQKKKQADEQTNFYANFFASNRTSHVNISWKYPLPSFFFSSRKLFQWRNLNDSKIILPWIVEFHLQRTNLDIIVKIFEMK